MRMPLDDTLEFHLHTREKCADGEYTRRADRVMHVCGAEAAVDGSAAAFYNMYATMFGAAAVVMRCLDGEWRVNENISPTAHGSLVDALRDCDASFQHYSMMK